MRIITILLLVFTIAILVFVIGNSSADMRVGGMVVNANTSSPVNDAQVDITQNGMGFIGGRFVWGQYYHETIITDSGGRFLAEGLADDTAIIRVEKEGYIPHVGFYPIKQISTIKLQPIDPHYVALRTGYLEIGIRDHKPFGWIFAERRTTFDPAEADIFLKSVNGVLSIQAPIGIALIPKDEIDVGDDMLPFTDITPTTGYSHEVELDVKSGGGVYFVITRPGKYAKFSFDPKGYATAGSNSDLTGDNWTLLLEYVFNHTGSSSLVFRR